MVVVKVVVVVCCEGGGGKLVVVKVESERGGGKRRPWEVMTYQIIYRISYFERDFNSYKTHSYIDRCNKN